MRKYTTCGTNLPLALLISIQLQHRSPLHAPPADKPPMFFDPPRKRDLFADLGTRGRRQLNLGEVAFHAQHTAARGRRANVDEQQLVLGQLRDLGLFLVFRPHAEKSTKQEQTNFEFRVHFWKLPDGTQDLSYQPICTAERRVNFGSDTDQATGHGEREVIGLCVQRDDPAKDRFASVSSRTVLGHDSWPDLDLLTEVEHTGEDRTTCDAAFQFVYFGSRFIHVKGTDDDEAWVGSEISDRDGDPFDDVFVDASMLYFNWADMGTMGDDSATVPLTNAAMLF